MLKMQVLPAKGGGGRRTVENRWAQERHGAPKMQVQIKAHNQWAIPSYMIRFKQDIITDIIQILWIETGLGSLTLKIVSSLCTSRAIMTIFEPGSNIHILQSEVRKYQHYLESTWMLPDWPNTSLLHTWIARDIYIYILLPSPYC